MQSTQRKAWIVFAEAFGEDSVRGVKPSSLSDRHIRTAEAVLNTLLDAFQADNKISTLSRLLKFKRPGALSVLGFASEATQWKVHRKLSIAPDALPFQDVAFFEWMQAPSISRGIGLRTYLPAMVSEDFGADDFPPTFGSEAAKRKVDTDLRGGSASFIRKTLLGR